MIVGGRPGCAACQPASRPELDSGADTATPQFRGSLSAVTLWRQWAGVKSVRAVLTVMLLAGMHQLAGCMSALGLQTDGTYLLEQSEEQASCDALQKSLWGRIQLINELPAKAKAEQAAPPPTASSLLGRWLGSNSKGLKAVEDYDRERAHAYALQRAMRQKRCPPIDVDREIAAAAAEMARIRQN
jgi:hypothetical protein